MVIAQLLFRNLPEWVLVPLDFVGNNNVDIVVVVVAADCNKDYTVAVVVDYTIVVVAVVVDCNDRTG